ncbi:DNA-3-methyladenine glycosylase [Paenibacillus ferrarius]
MLHFQPLPSEQLVWREAERTLIVPLPQPFHYGHNLDYLQRSTNECLYHIQDGVIYKLLPVAGQNVLITLEAGDDTALRIRILEPSEEAPSVETREAIADYVWTWLDLGTDLAPFYAMADRDPILGPVAASFHGLRLLGIPDLFEALSWGIIGQQINLPFAYTLKRRLVEQFGTSLTWEDRTFWAFPTPERIAALAPEDLTALQFTRSKADYLIGVAALMAEGALSKEHLLSLRDYPQMEQTLLRIRGIGPWTANYVLMRCLRWPSAFPLADVGLHNALKHVLQRSEKPALPEIRRMAEGWAGWEAYATFYLWRVLY